MVLKMITSDPMPLLILLFRRKIVIPQNYIQFLKIYEIEKYMKIFLYRKIYEIEKYMKYFYIFL